MWRPQEFLATGVTKLHSHTSQCFAKDWKQTKGDTVVF
jgi:hypothetical protein